MPKFLFVFILFLPFALTAQEADGYLANFGGTAYNKGAVLHWTTKKGFSCADIKIESSTDSVYYETLYTWPGICGGNTSEESYTYEVKSLTAGRRYFFRLNLGLYGFSSPIKLYVPFTTSTALIVPNPATQNSTLYFNLNAGEKAIVQLIDCRGNVVYFNANTTQNNLDFKNLEMESGVYSYQIKTDSKLFQGKFIYL